MGLGPELCLLTGQLLHMSQLPLRPILTMRYLLLMLGPESLHESSEGEQQDRAWQMDMCSVHGI